MRTAAIVMTASILGLAIGDGAMRTCMHAAQPRIALHAIDARKSRSRNPRKWAGRCAAAQCEGCHLQFWYPEQK